MKMLITRVVLLVAFSPLVTAQAAYAQRYHPAPQAYEAVGHSSARDYRFRNDDQWIIDQITRTDQSAGQ
jgi:hypothetical protein